MRRSKILRLAGIGALTLAGSLGSARNGQAQYAPSIPLDPYSSTYESYVYPIVPNNPAIPNAARYMDSNAGPNQLNRYFGQMSNTMDEAMGNLPAGAPDVRGRMIPYTSAFRRFDRDFNRVYQPNQNADAEYYQKRTQRDELYINAMTASDPDRRTEALRKLKEFDDKNQSLVGYSRRLGASSSTSATRPGTSSTPMRSTTVPAMTEPVNEEPFFAQAYGGVPTLHPYSSRVPLSRDFSFLKTAPTSDASSSGVGPAPTPDEVLNRSRNVDDSAIPPAPEPY